MLQYALVDVAEAATGVNDLAVDLDFLAEQQTRRVFVAKGDAVVGFGEEIDALVPRDDGRTSQITETELHMALVAACFFALAAGIDVARDAAVDGADPVVMVDLVHELTVIAKDADGEQREHDGSIPVAVCLRIEHAQQRHINGEKHAFELGQRVDHAMRDRWRAGFRPRSQNSPPVHPARSMASFS